LDLSFAGLIGPQRSKVKVVLRQACEFLPQLAGPHVAVVIDHCRRLAGSARHWPRSRLPEVGRLGSVVSSNGPDVGYVLDESRYWGISGKHPVSVALSQLRSSTVQLGQNISRHPLNLIARLGFAPYEVEVMPVKPVVAPQKLGELVDFTIVVGAN